MVSRIYGRGRGCAFTPDSFLDLGNRKSIDTALLRLTRAGTIRRLARGLYHYPEKDPLLGEVPPSLDALAKALAGRENVRLQPSGAYAANLLGLSEQVPARVIYLTSGRARKVAIKKLVIEMKPVSPRLMASAGTTCGLLTAAFRYLGKQHITPAHVSHLRKIIPTDERKQLLRHLATTPAWIHPHLRAIAAD